MATQPEKTFDLDAEGSTVLYFRGHPAYDAIRVDFDGDNSGSADVDVAFAVDTESEIDVVENAGFGAMDTVKTEVTLDASSGASSGTTALGRTAAVEITEAGTSSGAEGTVTLHNASDPAENADAFVQK